MPFIAYVHAEDRDPEGPRPWEPNLRVWRWIGLAALATVAATQAEGAAEALLVFIVFGLVCRAALEALPSGDGLRDYRQ
jgi:hypothetical protein